MKTKHLTQKVLSVLLFLMIHISLNAQNTCILQNNNGEGRAYVYVEAETMEVQPPLLIAEAKEASFGGYIFTPREPTAHFDFDVRQEGKYVLWARVINGGAGFRVFLDGEVQIKWRISPTSNAWHWVRVSDPKEARFDPLVINLEAGQHSISFEYAHNMDNPFLIDQVLLTDNMEFEPGRWVMNALAELPPGEFYLMEGEDARFLPPFSTGKDQNASGAAHLVLDCYLTTKQVYIPYDGRYKIWGRCLTPSGNTDSFFIGIGTTGKVHSWNNMGKKNGAWNWDYLRDRNNGDEMVITELHKGWNTLIVKQREGGAMLDRLLITNDMEYAPGD